jgi:VWFA-related protein
MRWMKSLTIAVPAKSASLLAVLFFLSATFLGQQVSPQEPSPQEPVFRAQSNVVLVPALVKDARGKIVYGLQASDFMLKDDDVEQSIQLDEVAEEQPISLIIAVQTDYHELGRMKGLASMLDPILHQENLEAAVVTFDREIDLAQDFTGNPDLVEKALNSIESGQGGAAVLDVVKYSANLLSKVAKDRQRVLLLISETRDHGSHFAKIDDVIASIGDSNIVVYALAFSPGMSNLLDTGRGSNKEDMSPGPDLLAPLILAGNAMRKNIPKTICSMTGGEYEMFQSRKRFETHLNDFDNHLHSRYLLSFAPKNPKPGLHEIRVQLKDPSKGSILARSNYWAEEPTQ